MEIRRFYSSALDEQCDTFTHDSGLRVTVCRRPDSVTGFAGLAADFGSMDTLLPTPAGDVRMPDGIAHFLEHKLFDNENGSADEQFSAVGAYSNAYTDYGVTCYHFTASQHFYETLRILLEFVISPYFTQESVKKEQGIIAQEIKMYDDAPGYQVYQRLIQAMYRENPVRIPIAGSVDSIARITPELLYDCYRTFYNLRNMMLIVVGDVETEEVIRLCDACLKPAPALDLRRTAFSEPPQAACDYTETAQPIGVPLFALGFKTEPAAPRQEAVRLSAAEIVLDLICGKSSDCYRQLYDNGLITAAFRPEFICGRGYAASVFSGESVDPKRVSGELCAAIRRLQENGISDEEFARASARLRGQMLRLFNSPETTGLTLLEACLQGLDPFAFGEAAFTATKADAEQFLRTGFDPCGRALSVITPASSQ